MAAAANHTLLPYSRWLRIFGWPLLLYVSACSQPSTSSTSFVMTTDKALLLTKAWCAEARESFENRLTVDSDGGFAGNFGAPDITYDPTKKALYVDGLVNYEASLLVDYPIFFDQVKRIGDKQPYTLGEGHFFLNRQPHNTKNTQLTLRKTFSDGDISPRQFVDEVNWLMQWATYWRKERYLQIGERDEADLLNEAPAIDARMRREAPRPR